MDNKNLSIKPVEARDLPWISAMLQKMVDLYFSHQISQEQIESLMAKSCTQEALSHEISNGMSYIKLVLNDDIQGIACYGPGFENEEMRLEKLFILPGEYETAGILTLLNFVIEQARHAGYGMLSLSLPPGDQHKLDLLSAQGFTLRGVESVYLCEGFPVESYVLTASLKDHLPQRAAA